MGQGNKSFTMTARYLPGLTMPTGHQPSDLEHPDDPKEVEDAYVEVGEPNEAATYVTYSMCLLQE
jgi:hypothetical protein